MARIEGPLTQVVSNIAESMGLDKASGATEKTAVDMAKVVASSIDEALEHLQQPITGNAPQAAPLAQAGGEIDLPVFARNVGAVLERMRTEGMKHINSPDKRDQERGMQELQQADILFGLLSMLVKNSGEQMMERARF